MKNLLLIVLVFSFQIGMAQNKIEKKWEVNGFAMPESVVADTNSNWLYVSNIAGRTAPGFISRVSKSGEIDKIKWIDDLDQPCGLAIYNGKLYVGDQSKLHIIDIEKAKIIKSLSAEGAMSLNDVAISADGKVFISDVMSGSIYTIENDQLVVWLQNTMFTHPNGLYADDGNLIVADLGAKLNEQFVPQEPGSVYKVNMKNKNVELINTAYRIGGLDGVVKVGKQYIVTNNSGGELLAITERERIVLGTFTPGNADLIAERDIIYIPNFAGTVTAFQLKQ